MKPNFALSLSFEGLKLLHRAAGGWREVGEVSVTSADLAGELAVLRKTAASLEPAGVRAKLIIPASQIKYLTIDTPDMSDDACRTAAEAALAAATPYAVSDLSYDISRDGAQTHIAAVARETLAEAEAFATEHRFHPVSFVAIPDDAPYLGEPFFGPTKGAAALLEQGEAVEPDGIAVVVVGKIPAADPMPTDKDEADQTAEAATADTKEEPAAASDAVQPAPQTENPAPAEPVEAENPPVQTPSEKTAPKVQKAANPVSDITDVAPPVAPELPFDPPETPVEKGAAAAVGPAPDATPDTAPDLKTPSADIPSPQGDAPAAPAITPAKPTLSAARKISVNASAIPDAPASGTSFSSRRTPVPTGAPAKPLGAAERSNISATPAPDSSSLDQPAALADVAAPAKTGFFSRRQSKDSAQPAAKPVAATATATLVGSEAERMTVFGARTAQVGGKPRFLGLIMTVILLVFLAGVAAWAAVFLDEGISSLMQKNKGRATASAPDSQIDPQIIRTPDGMTAQPLEGDDDVRTAALDPVLSAEETALRDPVQTARPEPQRPVISEQEAAARYAVTGIWPLAPATPLAQPAQKPDPVYLNTIDGKSTASDAIALPEQRRFDTDTVLAAVVSPPPFGQVSQRDAAGLVVPTAGGVVTPEGFTLVAASPPLKPPAAAFARAGVALPASAVPAIATATVASPLLGFRPRKRPIGLGEGRERAQLGGVTLSELAVYRPALRPSSIQERADAAREAEASEAARLEARATAAAQAAAAAAAAALSLPQQTAAVVPTLQNATRLATARSTRPDARPRNFARIVKRAQRAAPAQEQAETRVAAVASVAPRTVAPALPSKTSVARSATVKNAINLRRVNLIGVYGKPNSRRALVRLSNGRYQKVQVGDRIDGGRVSAIGASDLRYSKGGQNVVLKMP